MPEKNGKNVKVGNYRVTLTHINKLIFPKSRITKKMFIEYYYRIAPVMIPYLKNRPLTMLRYPNGIVHEGFYQKDAADYFPTWIKTVTVRKQAGGNVHYVLCNNAATLVYLANQLCITPHLWLSRADKLDYPDRMIFDLDPSPGVTFRSIRTTAYEFKALLEDLGLVPFIMTTGSRGVHVVIPLKRTCNFDQVRLVAYNIAQILVEQYPKQLTLELRKNKRGKRIFVDTLRNAWSATAVAPYAVRAYEGAPVAFPITWDELHDIEPQTVTIKNIWNRLDERADVWRMMHEHACALGNVQKKLASYFK